MAKRQFALSDIRVVIVDLSTMTALFGQAMNNSSSASPEHYFEIWESPLFAESLANLPTDLTLFETYWKRCSPQA